MSTAGQGAAPDGAERAPAAWVELLGLEPHPEGGWFRETWRSPVTLPVDALPAGYPGPRSAGTAISYLLAPGQRSRWHRVRSAELWLWQGGGPMALSIAPAAGRPPAARTARRVLVGPDPARGHLLHAVVPPGAWQAAEPGEPRPSLVACVVVPGFDFADFALAPADGEPPSEPPSEPPAGR